MTIILLHGRDTRIACIVDKGRPVFSMQTAVPIVGLRDNDTCRMVAHDVRRSFCWIAVKPALAVVLLVCNYTGVGIELLDNTSKHKTKNNKVKTIAHATTVITF
jgi:hypothetical protein